MVSFLKFSKLLTTGFPRAVFDTRPEYFTADAPMAKAPEAIIKTIHDCQTGRWVSVFKAQWSLNTEYGPHYSVSTRFAGRWAGQDVSLTSRLLKCPAVPGRINETKDLHLLWIDWKAHCTIL